MLIITQTKFVISKENNIMNITKEEIQILRKKLNETELVNKKLNKENENLK